MTIMSITSTKRQEVGAIAFRILGVLVTYCSVLEAHIPWSPDSLSLSNVLVVRGCDATADACTTATANCNERHCVRAYTSKLVLRPHPETKFTGKERDAETGLDYFGARYLSAAQGRFTSPDPLVRSASPPLPQTWNRYSYALNNPLRYIDPNGKCSVPAGVQGGQVGICIGSFIASKTIGGIGLGDNRGPVGNDPRATFRAQTQIIVDPAKGQILSNETKAGKSSVLIERLGIQGTATTKTSKPTVDDRGNIHFNISTSATNGFGESIFPAIDLSINLVVTPEGKVGVEGGKRDGYPSLEVYSYDAKGKATEILTLRETTPEDLKPPMEQDIEKRKPK